MDLLSQDLHALEHVEHGLYRQFVRVLPLFYVVHQLVDVQNALLCLKSGRLFGFYLRLGDQNIAVFLLFFVFYAVLRVF